MCRSVVCVIYWVLVECTYTLYIILYMYYYYIYNVVYYCIPFHLQLVINLYIILITSDACAIPRVVGRHWINVLVPRPSKACSRIFHSVDLRQVWLTMLWFSVLSPSQLRPVILTYETATLHSFNCHNHDPTFILIIIIA